MVAPAIPPGAPGVQYSRDSSGNVIGLKNVTRTLKLMRGNSVAVCGDSREMKMFDIKTPTSGSVTAGIMTITHAGHQRIPGERMNLALVKTIGGVSHEEVNNSYTVLDLVDANNFRIDLGNAALTGATNVDFQWTDNRNLSAEGYLTWLFNMSSMNGALEYVDNFAIGGAQYNAGNGSDILLQIDKAIALGVSVILLGGGINDFDAGTLTPAQVWANRKLAYAKIRAANIICIDTGIVGVATIWPSYTAGATGYTNKGHKINVFCVEVNRKIAKFCALNPGMIYLGLGNNVIDPSSITGAVLTSMTVSSPADGLHFNASGAKLSIIPAVPIITNVFPSVDNLPYSATQGFTRQGATVEYISSNPLFNDGSVGGTGIAATWAEAFSNTASTNSIVARTVAADGDTLGNNQVCAITSSAAGFYILKTAGSAQYTVADLIQAVGHLQVSNMSLVTYVQITLQAPAKNSLGTDVTYTYNMFDVGATFDNTVPLNLRFKTILASFPASYTAAASPNSFMQIVVGFSATGGTATLTLGRAGDSKPQPQ